MSTITAPATPTPTSTAPASLRGLGPTMPVKRWTTAEFDEMVRAGVIREGGPEFLWDGEIIAPMPENRAHINAVKRLNQLFDALFPAAEYNIDRDVPLALREGFKPEPDVIVLKGPIDRYRARTPVPADVVLLAEVADTSYDVDSGAYLREYAARGIGQYWIVNIHARRVEVYSGPSPTGYLDRKDYAPGQTVPVVGEHEGVAFDMGGVSVWEVLRYSVDAEAP